jgi:hypothetical protein
MVTVHDLTEMAPKVFKELVDTAKRHCWSEDPKDILFELDSLLSEAGATDGDFNRSANGTDIQTGN